MSVGCVNFRLGSSPMLLVTLFMTGTFLDGAVSLDTASVAAVLLRCGGGVVGFGVYLAVTA